MSEIEQSLIDIFVEVETGDRYIVTLVTPKFINYTMEQQNINFFKTGDPFIMVKKLTQEIIAETIKAYVEESEGYYLKLHHFGQRIPETVFNQLQAEDEAQDESDKGEELFTYIDMTIFDNLPAKAREIGILITKNLPF
jgi:hypothetical protein